MPDQASPAKSPARPARRHASADFADRAAMPFAAIKEHVLLPLATSLGDVDTALSAALTTDKIDAVCSLIPD